MTVRVSKPAFNLREKLSELDKPTGIHGTQLMRSSDIEETFDLVGAGRKNFIINGSTIVWQRGTSNPSVSNYGCDRFWKANGATQVDRSTITPAGFSYSIKVTSNGSTTSMGQPIELTSTGRSQFEPYASYTLSFYARTESGENDISSTVYYRNAKFSNTNQTNWGPNVTQGMGTLTTSFQRFSKTFTAPAAPNANNQILAIEFNNSATYYITGVQFEKGKAATPFEHRSYVEELALCQRYFNVWPPRSGGTPAWPVYTGGSQASGYIWIPYTMRAIPTPTDKGTGSSSTTGHAYNNNGTSVSTRYANGTSPTLSCGGDTINGHYALKMDFGSYSSGGHEADIASWNGTSPGIFLDSEF